MIIEFKFFIMKKLFFISTPLIILTILLNFSNSDNFQPNQNIIGLDNLKIMNASAGEAYCKQITQNKCVIEVPDASGEGTGQPYINY